MITYVCVWSPELSPDNFTIILLLADNNATSFWQLFIIILAPKTQTWVLCNIQARTGFISRYSEQPKQADRCQCGMMDTQRKSRQTFGLEMSSCESAWLSIPLTPQIRILEAPANGQIAQIFFISWSRKKCDSQHEDQTFSSAGCASANAVNVWSWWWWGGFSLKLGSSLPIGLSVWMDQVQCWCVCMYVCMYVICMYVYSCMYVCMYIPCGQMIASEPPEQVNCRQRVFVTSSAVWNAVVDRAIRSVSSRQRTELISAGGGGGDGWNPIWIQMVARWLDGVIGVWLNNDHIWRRRKRRIWDEFRTCDMCLWDVRLCRMLLSALDAASLNSQARVHTYTRHCTHTF